MQNQIEGLRRTIMPTARAFCLWFRSLPIVTRYWFGAAVAVTLAANVGVVRSSQLMFHWPAITQKLELWRIVTSFLYMGSFGINTMIHCYMLVTVSQKYEGDGPFNTGAGGSTADYAYCLMFAMASMLLTFPLFGISQLPPLFAGALLCTAPLRVLLFELPTLFSGQLVYFVLYLWSKRHPTAPASLWLVRMPAKMLPYACLAFRVMAEGGFMDVILGFLVGHVYYVLADVVPRVRGRDVLATPQFLINYFRIGEWSPASSASASTERDDNVNNGTPQRIIDANLSEEERARIRADRAAAAEARLRLQTLGAGATSKVKKKVTGNCTPLTGPFSQPTMRWTAG